MDPTLNNLNDSVQNDLRIKIELINNETQNKICFVSSRKFK